MNEVPWCGPIDDNPSNIRAAADGSLRVTDPYYVPSAVLFQAVLDEPSSVARAIPPDRRRHMFQIPLAESGGLDPARRREMEQRMAEADAALNG
jgi:hypothetical protein